MVYATSVPDEADHVATPLAQTSGFVRPSAVGPRDEKLATVPAASTAPTESILKASAGAISELADEPELPIASQTTMPRPAAMLAPIVVTAVAPSKSENVYQSI